MGKRTITIDVDLNNSKLLDKLLKLQKTQDEVDFVVKQLLSKIDCKCKCVNPIPLAKDFNLPYDSQIALLLTLLLENK